MDTRYTDVIAAAHRVTQPTLQRAPAAAAAPAADLEPVPAAPAAPPQDVAIEGRAPMPPEVLAAAAFQEGTRGIPIPLPHRTGLEERLGRSLANVRCFTGPAARRACASVGARAFTVQDTIVFAEPSPPFEVALHEVVHVLQQGGDQKAAGNIERLALGSFTNAAEEEARQVVAEVDALAPAATYAPELRATAPRLDGFFYLSGCSEPKTTITTGPKGVSNADGNGWLKAKVGGVVRDLPWFLKVSHTARNNSRDEFTVLEGLHSGQTGSVVAKSSTDSHLVDGLTYKAGASVVFKKGTRKMKYGGSGWFDAMTDEGNPLPTGSHEIQIPDEPHGLGAKYGSFATTWFRLGTSGDRYLHPGSVSLGCATVSDTSQWPDLYRYLINSRQSATAVGTIEVQD